jgi:DNA mismatch repair protein MSH6
LYRQKPRSKMFQKTGPKAALLKYHRLSISYTGKTQHFYQAFSRWLVPSLSTTIRRVKEGRENRNQAIKNFKLRVFAEFDADRSVWLRAIRILAELDCLFSLAKSSAALDEPICRPELVEGDAAFIDFEELRHPALSSLKGDFIPNDVKLGDGVGRIALLTGRLLCYFSC